jgi:hypothetical protein
MNRTQAELDAVRASGVVLAGKWAALWCGDYELADEILAPDFRIHVAASVPGADTACGPGEFVAFVLKPWRRVRPGVVVALEDVPMVDGEGDLVSIRWLMTHDADPAGKSGIDQLKLRHHRISRVWSASGPRAFRNSRGEIRDRGALSAI